MPARQNPSQRTSCCFLVLTAIVLLASACGGNRERTQAPPNIVLIMTDDQGWAQVGSHGNQTIRTPHVDSFAAESVEFTRFYVSPVCAPTRASLMTGRYNYRTGVVDTYLGRAMMDPDEVTLAEILRGAGYATGIFGKWHLGDNYPMRPMEQGFDESLVHRGGGIHQPSDPAGSDYFDPILQHNGAQEKKQGYCTDVFFQAALQFIEQHREQPFFAYIPTNAPHSPYLAPQEYIDPYLQAGLSDKDACIYGMITNIDDNVGKLLEKLESLGLEENTIVIFMTDNGPTTQHFTAGLRAQKASVYEGGIRVPFFLRWPAKFEPRKIDHIAAHIDVTPTLLEAVQIDNPEGVSFDGVSLMRMLKGGEPLRPDGTIYIQSHRGNEPQLYRAFAAISEQYKLVQPLSFGEPMPADAPFELYDIEADAGEQNNLAAAHPEIVDKMKQGYEAWFRDVSATRGYDPPAIGIGSSHENPVTLTRQDWRVVGEDGWSDEHLGYWQVDVLSAGLYEILFSFPSQDHAGRAEFRLGNVELDKPFAKAAESIAFQAELPAGPGLIEARLVRGGKTAGVTFVDVRKVE